MTQGAALYEFFNKAVGIDAYEASTVPTDRTFPYLTYTGVSGSYGDSASITVYIYDYTTGAAKLNAYAKRLADAISLGGVYLPCDGGAIILHRGSPWCQSQVDSEDNNVKIRYINVEAEFIVAES